MKIKLIIVKIILYSSIALYSLIGIVFILYSLNSIQTLFSTSLLQEKWGNVIVTLWLGITIVAISLNATNKGKIFFKKYDDNLLANVLAYSHIRAGLFILIVYIITVSGAILFIFTKDAFFATINNENEMIINENFAFSIFFLLTAILVTILFLIIKTQNNREKKLKLGI